MRPFTYARAGVLGDALGHLEPNAAAGGADVAHKVIAGGTNLLDLMKADVMRPAQLVDITRLPLRTITETPDGGLLLGALVTNAATAYDARVDARYPLLAKAILAGASAQLRNMATDGGNLLQRTRCYYFYDTATPCNKREPGSGCSALAGVNRIHAILGTSEACIAVHPSDMCVALAALAATVHVTGSAGARAIPFADFHRLPGDTPHLETALSPRELITGIELPAAGFATHHAYVKVRDRHSYAFALVSCAAAFELDASGTITAARIALGGVAHKPWRDPTVEALLVGKPPGPLAFRAAADALLEGAVGREHNQFKIELAKRVIRRALADAQGVV